MPDRLSDTIRFYDLLARLAQRVGGPQLLDNYRRSMSWPQRAVYFFFEPGETRSWSGSGPRVVRIGISENLRGRLNSHRRDGGASIFRTLLGNAFIHRDKIELPASWRSARPIDPVRAARRFRTTLEAIRQTEEKLQAHVSHYIGRMPFLYLNVDDPPSPNSQRAHIERNAIALLSAYNHSTADKPSSGWLGHHSDREKVRLSGLWNNNHVDEAYNPSFLNTLERCIESTHAP